MKVNLQMRWFMLPMVALACCPCQNGFAARKPTADVPKGWVVDYEGAKETARRDAKRITVDEEAAFMSDAAGMDAFAIYREFGIPADDKKSVYGWGGFQLKKELTIPHGWTAEELK